MTSRNFAACCRPWLQASLKLVWATYLILTSVYSLLAFFPYTYYALIKSPVYAWTPWFARQHANLYWLALLAGMAAHFQRRTRVVWAILFAGMLAAGTYLHFDPVLPNLAGGMGSYILSVAALLPPLIFSAVNLAGLWREDTDPPSSSILYLPAAVSAIVVSIFSFLGPILQDYRYTHSSAMHAADLERSGWSIVTHVVLAMLAVSFLNLVFILSSRVRHPRLARFVAIGFFIFVLGSYGMTRFLAAAFGFVGWTAVLFSTVFVATVILVFLSIVLELSMRLRTELQGQRVSKVFRQGAAPYFGAVILCALAVLLPSSISEWDWNGVFQWTFTVFLWCSLTVCIYRLGRTKKTYSVSAIIAIIIVVFGVYKVLLLADVIWGASLGRTDDEISEALESYAARDVSFRMAHYLLGNAPKETPCSDFCHILSQYTNIRDAHTDRKIDFINSMTSASGKRPDIFMIVVDSMRPDYMGAYNAKADFTPNMDALARDSVVLRHAYTQYSGTYLSEPAIWSGALLLHAHYIRPFENVNSLERLLNTDGYDMVVSYDNVLSELLSKQDHLAKLDTDKKSWKALDFCSTVQQLEGLLDSRPSDGPPLFFYAQPQNVHMFASNDEPTVRSTHWHRDGFEPRVSLAMHQVDACLGDLLAYLKAHGLYRESIIVLASDHGDGVGDFGRRAHSYVMYPEVMRVPLVFHLPESIRQKVTYDPDRLTVLTDITPSLYYLLGHRPLNRSPILGQTIFVKTREELSDDSRGMLFMSSDEVPLYGLLDKGRYFYTTYAFPSRSALYDLEKDPNGQHNILTAEEKKRYDLIIIDDLKMIGDFYGYKLGVNALLASQAH